MTNLKGRAAVLWREHLRLILLQLLAEQPGYRANTALLADAAAELGFGGTREQVEAHLGWLSDQGLAVIADRGAVLIAVATGAGLDVASGRRQMSGVRVPTPDYES